MGRPRLPLHALLSQLLVALTIEVDNTYEGRAPHHTTNGGGFGPWLTSYVMWANLLRLVPPEGPEGVSTRDLAALAGFDGPRHPGQAGMERWGYLRVAPDGSAGARGRSSKAPARVTRTPAAERAASFWHPLPSEIEDRWVERFGPDAVDGLRAPAESIVARRGVTLPGYLPQVASPLFTPPPQTESVVPGEAGLITALANVLHSLAIDIERNSPVALAVGANVLRVVDEEGVRVADIPARAGIGKEAAAWATKVLDGTAVSVGPAPEGTRGKVVRLTADGDALRTRLDEQVRFVEQAWAAEHGPDLERLRGAAIEVLSADEGGRLRAGLEAPSGCWRAGRSIEVLPHFPMVLHRGGYPDGS